MEEQACYLIPIASLKSLSVSALTEEAPFLPWRITLGVKPTNLGGKLLNTAFPDEP